MLPKYQKLTSQEHTLLVQHAKRKHTGYFSLQYMESPSSQQSRCAVVVPKKQYNRAVQRNRIRRNVFAILTKRYPQLKSKYLISIVLRKNIDELKQKALYDELTNLLAPVLKNN